MSIFRNSIQKDIRESLENRQEAMGKRETKDSTFANNKFIQYINTRNAWIKMTSSVNVGGLSTFAEGYVLQGGVLTSGGNLKSGVGESSDNAYSLKNPGLSTNKFGIRPMPGITSVDIKSKSAYGSLREAVVNFQCWDIAQLEELELLYMRPGFTVLVEWGWVPYIDKDGKYNSTFNNFYSSKILKAASQDRTVIFKELYDKSVATGGNYDAIFGYIKNYQWSARTDGGYDCSTTIISTGEIVESLKVNYVRADLKNYNMYNSSNQGDGFVKDLFSNKGTLYTWKLAEFYQKNILAGIWAEIALKLANGGDPAVIDYGLRNSNGTRWVVQNYPGLVGSGDSNQFIDSTNPNKYFINLGAFVDIMNKYVIARSANGSKEPLVSLSVYSSTYNGSSAEPLKCIAHPLQVSVDPTVCIIKSPNWYTKILPGISTAATTAAAPSNAVADAIVQELIDASDDSLVAIRGVDINKFLTAVRKINTPLLYGLVDQTFIRGTDSTGKSINRGSTNWTYSNGFLGLLTEQFITKNSDVPAVTTSSTTSTFYSTSTAAGQDLVTLHVFNKIRDILNPLGYILDADLNGKTTAVGSTKLSTILLSATPSPIPDYFIGVKIGGADFTFSFVSSGTSSTLTSYIIKDYNITGVSIVASGGAAAGTAATTLVLSTSDALAVAQQLDNIPKDYFDTDPELGIIGNIFVSLDFLYKQSLSSGLESSDNKEKNEINLYTYLKSIMNAVQQSIGNINNFDIHVDPVDNVARIIDINYTGDDKKKDLFKLEVQNLKSIVRSYNLQSQIFPNQSAAIAIGSQAKGGQLGVQNGAIIDFNKSLTDRIFPKKEDYGDSFGQNSTTNPIMASSLAGIVQLFAALGATVQPGQTVELSRYISQAKNALRDLIIYFQNLYSSSSGNRGIIPTKFSFEMDGIGGLIIGSLFRLDDSILPKGYRGVGAGTELAQTITGISHTLQNNDWITKVDALNIVLDRSASTFKATDITAIVKEAVDIISQAGVNSASSTPSTPSSPPSPGSPPPPPSPSGPVTKPGKKSSCTGKLKNILTQAEIASLGITAVTPWSAIKTTIPNAPVNVKAIGSSFLGHGPAKSYSKNGYAYIMGATRQGNKTSRGRVGRISKINYIVLHYTAGYGDSTGPLREYTGTWEGTVPASADFTISREGGIAGFKNFKEWNSWHYGNATWGGNFSDESIGIEIESTGPASYCESSGKFLDYYGRELRPDQICVTQTYDGHNIWEAHPKAQIRALAQLIVAIYNSGAIDDKTTFWENMKATGRNDIMFPASKLRTKPKPGIVTHGTGSNKGKIDDFPQTNMLEMLDNLKSFITLNPKIVFNWVDR